MTSQPELSLQLPTLISLSDDGLVMETQYPGLMEEWPQWSKDLKTRLTMAVLEQADAVEQFRELTEARLRAGIKKPLEIRIELARGPVGH